MIGLELGRTYCMPIEDIPNKNAFETKDVNNTILMPEVGPINNGTGLLIITNPKFHKIYL
jgi:hypothetical protein